MRRTIFVVGAVALVLVPLAPGATAIPQEAKGCAAEPSVWTEISSIAPGSADWDEWEASELHEWYWGLPGAVENLRNVNPGITDEEIDEGVAGFFAYIDRNGDEAVCATYMGWIPSPNFGDSAIAAIDNNANAMK